MKEENRIKKDLDNEINIWWLRSVGIYYNGIVACVNYYGSVGHNGCGDGGGVVPAFII